MELRLSRRLTGPSLWLDGPGAVLEVFLEDGDADPVPAWREALKRAHATLGWPRRAHSRRSGERHLALAIEAPFDCLLCATYVNEWAAAGGPEDELPALAARAAEEVDPAVREAVAEAERRGVPWFLDAEGLTVGLGRGAVTVPRRTGAAGGSGGPAEGSGVRVVERHDLIPWDEVSAVPLVLVTGTNGKTTTVRLLARMARCAGHTVGATTSDGIAIDGALVEAGDWTGPGGARRVLRDPRVTWAVLETARGGMLRRGLVLPRVDAAAVTNVTADHLGAHGIDTLAQLAEVKLIVGKAARHLVLNADDPELAGHEAGSWFSLEHEVEGAWLAGDELVCGTLHVPAAEVPVTLGGAARYHVANALAAMALARATGLPDEAIAAGLRSLRPTPEDNPARANLLDHRGVFIFLDYAHNPDGLQQTMALLRRLAPGRIVVSLGLPGDRDDEQIRASARVLLDAAPALVIARELGSRYLRGRRPGEVPGLIRQALLDAGLPPERVAEAASEPEAMELAMRQAAPGDLVAVLPHVERDAVRAWLEGGTT
ncbi:MAG TPA: Mur ligase family protein [Thermoanaerobaculaceae bacterium]|nr:Mur ligase family protein [Thermoanaerobaculaceae bacterium]HRS16070.1 Mur ligase family protein [Thermoanaerobaculaceae bacterium]